MFSFQPDTDEYRYDKVKNNNSQNNQLISKGKSDLELIEAEYKSKNQDCINSQGVQDLFSDILYQEDDRIITENQYSESDTETESHEIQHQYPIQEYQSQTTRYN